MGMRVGLATQLERFEGIRLWAILLENRLSLVEEVVCWLDLYGEIW